MIASHQAAVISQISCTPSSQHFSAMAIIISYEFGARRMDAVKSYSKLGRLTALGFSIFTLIFLYFLRYDLVEHGHEPDFFENDGHFHDL